MIEENKVGTLISADGNEVTLKSVNATGQISGLLLTMKVRQNYKNTTAKNLETTYTFPMGWGAIFMGFSAEINGLKLNGTVVEKELAHKQYETAVTDGDSPIMLEKNSDGLYTVNLGNLQPNEEAVIEYKYAQLLKIEDSTIRVSIPTTIAPRYGNSQNGGIKIYQSTEASLLVEYPLSLSIDIDGELSKSAIESPSHQVSIQSTEDKTSITLSKNGYLDRDFILNLNHVKNQSFFSEIKDEYADVESYTALASFCPQFQKNTLSTVDLKILVDCSGSMAGDSINSAKNALSKILSELKVGDRFSYSKFGDDVCHLFNGLKPVNKINLAAAGTMIALTEADMGGTEFERALVSTFKLPKSETQSNILLITDGEIWDIDSIVSAAKKSGNRIFAIGVGSSPAETLLQKLAEETSGACELVSPNEDIETAIIRMFNRIRSERVTELEINWGSKPKWTTALPSAIYDGDTIHIFAGFNDQPNETPTLIVKQEKTGHISKVQADRISKGVTELARIGAHQLILSSSNEEQISLALQYQLITDNTNYILIHQRSDNNKPKELPELQKINQMQAASWSGSSTVVRYSKNTKPLADLFSFSPQNNIDYSQYDVPKVFRSNKSNYSKTSFNRDPSYYDIPAFLRKQVEDNEPQSKTLGNLSKLAIQKIKEKFTKTDPTSPIDIIKLANSIIKKPSDLDKFIKTIETQLMPEELEIIINQLNSNLNLHNAWIVILAWLLLNFESSGAWSSETKHTIHELSEKVELAELSQSFKILATHMDTLTIDSWF